MLKYTKLFLFLVLMTRNEATGEELMETIRSVSIIQLIATPDQYHNKLIRVKGFSTVPSINKKSRGMLYLSSSDYEHNIYANSIGLDLNYSQKKKYSKYGKQYCIIEGRFNAKKISSNLVENGLIENIERFDISQ